MIIYGYRTKVLGSDQVIAPCPNCGGVSLRAHITQKYFHIYWIPLFPMPRAAVLQCPSCSQQVEAKTLEVSAQGAVERIRGLFRTPAYMFSGLVLIAAIAAYSVVHERKQLDQTKAFHHAPAKGDLVVFFSPGEDKTYPIRIGRVEEAKADVVGLSLAKYAYGSKEEAEKAIDRDRLHPEDYMAEIQPLSKTEFERLDVRVILRTTASESN